MSDRYPELTPDAMTAEQRAVAGEISSGPRGSVRGPFLPLLHNPELARRVQALGEHLRFNTGFAGPLVEIAVLLTARRWTCQYEWLAHERIARKAGLDASIIEAIAGSRVPERMSADEAAVYAFCRQVNDAGSPDDATFAAARDRFGLAATLDLIALCGYYTLLAMVLNTADPALPDGAAPPLSPAGG